MFSVIPELSYINGVNKLRYSAVATLYKRPDLTMEEAVELARNMGHDERTARNVYLHDLIDG